MVPGTIAGVSRYAPPSNATAVGAGVATFWRVSMKRSRRQGVWGARGWVHSEGRSRAKYFDAAYIEGLAGWRGDNFGGALPAFRKASRAQRVHSGSVRLASSESVRSKAIYAEGRRTITFLRWRSMTQSVRRTRGAAQCRRHLVPWTGPLFGLDNLGKTRCRRDEAAVLPTADVRKVRCAPTSLR